MELPALSPEQVRETIGAAHRALPGWRALAAKDRSKIIRRWFDLVTKRAEDLAAILTLEEGKPLAGARAEVAYAASLTEWFAEEAKRVRGDVFSALAGLAPDHRSRRGDHPEGSACSGGPAAR